MVAIFKPAACPPRLLIPVAGSRVQAGFPSPADDYVEAALDLNELLITHKAATFFWRVRGRSMEGAGILSEDLLVVDRAVTASDRDIVIAAVDGEFTVKRLRRRGTQVSLEADAPGFAPIVLKEGQEMTVWGVVVGCVRRFR
ncbi:MAG: translesion error-prone DNA polymerase V autoproteolytic subunit [Methylibium sp.]|uniref:LexA family protein n=1 Tax=Methylibium sp. TaxID=2067992 RepID=UPI00181B6013|nr:translesion error-prone DNA polymerase V autoproteolytic subunit [Methylibium sp.]MBA3597734.1 translesion error-prone DNA polymerase V autoproteolytic subunit [Methylibium sp.]